MLWVRDQCGRIVTPTCGATVAKVPCTTDIRPQVSDHSVSDPELSFPYSPNVQCVSNNHCVIVELWIGGCIFTSDQFLSADPHTLASNPRDAWPHVWGIPEESLLSHDTTHHVTRTTSGPQTSYLSISNWPCLCVCSGGGGNFVLSSSLVGYTTVLGAVAPMVQHGYGFFYRIRDDRWARASWRFMTRPQSGFSLRSQGQRRRTEPSTTSKWVFFSSLTSGSSSRSQRGNPATTPMPCRCSTASPAPCTRCTTWPPHPSCRQMS